MTAVIRVQIPPELRPLLEQAGLDTDLSITSVAVAILEAAFRTRTAGNLLLNSLQHNKVKTKRRPVKRVWEPVGKHGYMLGEYTMTREGTPGKHDTDDGGWYVEGPGIERTNLGQSVREAWETATIMVARIEPELVG